MRWITRVERAWRAAGGGGVLAAVSGGGDSVALLHLLARARERFPPATRPDLVVAHVDHSLREDSGADAGFVRDLAADLDLEVLVRTATPAEAAGMRGEGGTQAGARDFRRRVLLAWAAARTLPLVALAHTRDDQAETLLANLLRGSGTRGLAGMLPEGPGPLWRPLLDVPRSALREWLAGNDLTWREDPGNARPEFLRSRIRGELLPLLEDLRPGAAGALARAAGHLAADEDHLVRLAEDWMARFASPLRGGGLALEVGPLKGAASAVRTRVFARVVEELGGSSRLDAHEHARLEALLATGRTGAQAFLRPGVRVLHAGLALHALPGVGASGLPEEGVPLPGAGSCVELPGDLGVVEVLGEAGEGTVFPFPEGWDLVLRHPRPGDRFRPASLSGGSKRLARYLRDRGMSRAARERALLVAHEDRVLAVVGLEGAHDDGVFRGWRTVRFRPGG